MSSSPRTAEVEGASPVHGGSKIANLPSTEDRTSAISATRESHVENTTQLTATTTSDDWETAAEDKTTGAKSPLNATNGHAANGNLATSSSPAPQPAENQRPGSSSLKRKGLHSERNSPVNKPLETQLASTSPGLPANSSLAATAEPTKLNQEIARLNEVLAQTSPEAAQRVLRQHWRTFLFEHYNEDHISFILRAGLKNSNFSIIDRVFKDEGSFKEPLIAVLSKKRSILARALQNASDREVLGLLPKSILDRALSDHLKHVPAKELIRWLAEADRLGYSLDDILDEEDESVLPNVLSRPQTSDDDAEMTGGVDSRPHLDLALPYRDPLLAEQERNAAAAATSRHQAMQGRVVAPQLPHRRDSFLKCPTCHRQFANFNGYSYHVTKKVCLKEPPLDGWKGTCKNCHRSFSTKQGLLYHEKQNVCHADAIARTASPSSQLHQEAAAVSTRPSPHNHLETVVPPARPTFTTQPREPERPISTPHAHQPRHTVGSIPRPPLHTPAHHSSPIGNVQQQFPPGIRQSPSELDPAKKDEMDRKIQAAEDRFQHDIAAIPKTYTMEERNQRITSLKQASATRKSQIRKAFGVSLRMREKDKAARNAVMASTTSPSTSRLESFRAPPPTTGPSTSTPVRPSPAVTGFSPINAPSSRTGPSSTHVHHAHPPTFRGSPLASTTANNPTSEQETNTDPNFRGFGVLRPGAHFTSNHPSQQNDINHQTPASYAHTQAAKRRRTTPSGDDEGHVSQHFQNNGPSSGLSLMQIRAEVAASKINAEKARKVPVGAAQARWEALQPRNGASEDVAEDTAMSEVLQAAQPRVGTAQEAIVLSSESKAEVGERPVESVEKGSGVEAGDKEKEREMRDVDETEDEERIPATAPAAEKVVAQADGTSDRDRPKSSGSVGRGRGGFMAKRGGHRGRH